MINEWCKTRIARRQGWRKRMPSPPGPESRTLRHIEVHTIHELDCRDVSAGCLASDAPLAAFALAPRVLTKQRCNMYVI